jgi:hypothetical protein
MPVEMPAPIPAPAVPVVVSPPSTTQAVAAGPAVTFGIASAPRLRRIHILLAPSAQVALPVPMLEQAEMVPPASSL